MGATADACCKDLGDGTLTDIAPFVTQREERDAHDLAARKALLNQEDIGISGRGDDDIIEPDRLLWSFTISPRPAAVKDRPHDRLRRLVRAILVAAVRKREEVEV